MLPSPSKTSANTSLVIHWPELPTGVSMRFSPCLAKDPMGVVVVALDMQTPIQLGQLVKRSNRPQSVSATFDLACYHMQALMRVFSLDFRTLFIVDANWCVEGLCLSYVRSSDHQHVVTHKMAAFRSSSTCCWKAFTNRRAASPRFPAGLERYATFLFKCPYTWVHLV